MRVVSIKNSFNTGEISALALGRTDLDKYRNALESCQNWTPILTGGLAQRPGTRFICNAFWQQGPSRLSSFEYSLNQSFVFEWGDRSLRFYTNKAQIQELGPAWNGAFGGTTVDGALTWTNRGYAPWPANFAATTSTVIIDSNGNVQLCTSAGTTGASAPVWATNNGGTTTDNGATWTCQNNPRWASNQAFAANAVIYNGAGGIQQVTAGGGGNSGNAQSRTPYQIPTPYSPALAGDSLWDLKFAQQADVVYIVHPNHPVGKLSRVADNNWIYGQPMFYGPPLIIDDQNVAAGTITLTPAATGGTGIAFTASAPVFIAADVGKAIVSGVGLGFITALSGSTTTDGTTGATLYPIATVTVIDSFQSTAAIQPANWVLRGSAQCYVGYGSFNTTTWDASRKLGVGTVLNLFAFSAFPVDTATGPSQEDAFRVADVGRYILLSGSVGQVVSVVSSTELTVRLLSAIVDTYANSNGAISAAPASGGAWSIQDPAFSPAYGYPRACCFFQDRLVLAGTIEQPEQTWMSVTGDYENFCKGPEDANALDFGLASGRLENIVAVIGYGGVLFVHTMRTEYAVAAGSVPTISGNTIPLAGTLTPSNVTVLEQSEYGTNYVQPVRVDTDLVYIKRSTTALGAISYSIQESNYVTRNLTILSELITTAGFKEMVYQQFPNRILWFTTLDNKLVALTFEKQNDVWAWSRHFTGIYGGDGVTTDAFVSVAAIADPALITDQVWAVCLRTLNGQQVYTVELFDPTLYVDCGSQAELGASTEVLGLAYLSGRAVVVNAGGALQPGATIGPAGTYTFPPGVTANDVQIGLPIIWTALTVRLEIQVGNPTAQGLLKRWARLWLRVYNTQNLVIDGVRIDFRNLPLFGQNNLPAIPQFTGDVELEPNQDYDRDGRVTIVQDQPMPAAVLAMFGTVSVGDN